MVSPTRSRDVHARLEATSTYGEAMAAYLHEQGHRVSVVNPSRIKGFALSELLRNKTVSFGAWRSLITRLGKLPGTKKDKAKK